MNITNSIRKFFGADVQVVHGVHRGTSMMSFNIISYALSLGSKPGELTAHRNRLKLLANDTDERAAIKLYADIEQYLITKEPARKFTRDGLRKRIAQRFPVNEAVSGLSLLFDQSYLQELKLATLIINGVLSKSGKFIAFDQLKEIIEETTKQTPLSNLAINHDSVDLSPTLPKLTPLSTNSASKVIAAMARIFRSLSFEIESAKGDETNVIFDQAYVDVQNTYADYIDDFSRIAMLMPEGVQEEEKLRYFSRETLEQKVRDKTKQLEAEKASVEEIVKQRTKELFEAQARIASTIESLPQGLLMIGSDNEILLHNESASKILHHTEQTWNVNELAQDLGGTFDLIKDIQSVRSSGKPHGVTEVNLGPKILSILITPVFAQRNVIGVLIVIEDITEAKVLERSKDEFFSIASHELRTPLTAIQGNASMILEYYKPVLKDHQLNEMVNDILESSVRLIELVNDFLDTSRLEQGKIKFKLEPFKLDRVIEQVAYEMGQVLKQKGLYLHVGDGKAKLDDLPMIYADINRTKQVIYNLIGNATKFTENGGITVTTEIQDKYLRILVTDTGMGIAVQQQKLLFHKFQQAGVDILARDTTRGTGLGLYISKLLVGDMGGKLGLLESKPGVGTTFFFTLPIASGATAKVPVSTSTKEGA